MCKCHVCAVVAAMVLSGGLTRANLVHHWKLNEDTTAGATSAVDSAGGLDGTISGAASAEGVYGNALYFDGNATVEITGFSTANLKTMTLAFWINPDAGYTQTPGWKRVISANDGWEAILNENTGLIGNNLYRTGGTYAQSTAPPPEGEWTHVAMTADLAPPGTGRQEIYVNGVLDAEMENQAVNDWAGGTFLMGYRAAGGGEYYEGMLDDVRIYDTVLSEAEVQMAMQGGGSPELASDPDPADEAIEVWYEATLGWTAGKYAVLHDVYFGTDFDDVNSASRNNTLGVLVAQGQTDVTYDPGRLGFEQTYYWRIDEVNGAPDNTIFKGEIWSFTAEPFAYPIQDVTAISNAISEEGKGPENTINGSGLNVDDQHSTITEDMWSGAPAGDDETVYIQFEFDRVYKLHEMLVWNYNMDFESFLGVGVKQASVEYSVDGINWTMLGDVELAQGPGVATYTHNSIVSFEGVAAQMVRLTAINNYGAPDLYGLSEVRFMYVPATASKPSPMDGATDVDIDAILSWRPGRGAASHDVYLSTNADDLIDSAARVTTTTQSRYDPGVLSLDSTYLWKVVEVNEAEVAPAWEGDVWSFTTLTYLLVEGFESYNDDIEAGQTIWQNWVDGIDDPTNGGGVVGYGQSPFAEMAIVRGGRQSMPFFYNNTGGVSFSEADYTFAVTQDWARANIGRLRLYFQGAADNAAGQMYVRINGVKVPYEGDAADMVSQSWIPWDIDLAAVGTNLGNVTTLSFGVDASGAGVVYVDDIQLLPAPVGDAILLVSPVGAIDITGDDGAVQSINGLEVGDLVLGTTTTDFEKHADHPAVDADDFDLSTYASLDDSGYVITMFDVPVTTVFIVERGGNDQGLIEPLDANGNPLGEAVTFAANDWLQPGVTIDGQAAGAMVIESGEPMFGIRIWPPVDGNIGIDPASISAIPAQ